MPHQSLSSRPGEPIRASTLAFGLSVISPFIHTVCREKYSECLQHFSKDSRFGWTVLVMPLNPVLPSVMWNKYVCCIHFIWSSWDILGIFVLRFMYFEIGRKFQRYALLNGWRWAKTGLLTEWFKKSYTGLWSHFLLVSFKILVFTCHVHHQPSMFSLLFVTLHENLMNFKCFLLSSWNLIRTVLIGYYLLLRSLS